ncbi:unnamed protein product [Effrenium voratum]|uniref:Uncharacterized protein n=1 Tax=Effrenium voratum TaxID=2562239 RepID=A0AA36HUW3_9DINO|nr:unnamed protein product [Effrenium voratum]
MIQVQLLWEAGRRKEAVLEARQQLVANPGSWAHAQDYARLVFDLPLEGDVWAPSLKPPEKAGHVSAISPSSL